MGKQLARLMAIVVFSCFSTGLAFADTIVVAGTRVPSPAPFVMANDDIFVPLLPALWPLKAKTEVAPDRITITTASGREIEIQRQRAEATVDGSLHTLPALIKEQGKTLLFPVKAIGELLGCAVRWEEATRTVYLHPMLRTFTVETTPDYYRVTVRSEQPMNYRTRELNTPARLVIDFVNTELAEAFAPYQIADSYFRVARIGQFTLAPDPKGSTSRVVLEFSEWRPYRIKLSEDRCRLDIELALPNQELPSDAPPVTLSDFRFQRLSQHAAAAIFSLSPPPLGDTATTEMPTTVWVEVENAENQIDKTHLLVTDHWIRDITIEPIADKRNRQRITLALTEPVPTTVSNTNNQVRILLGQCELTNLTIVVDPGHGGNDTGAIGRTGLREKNVNLDIATRVGQLLQAAGANVLFTRCDDSIVKPLNGNGNGTRKDQLRTRCEIANNAQADLFVSVHCNSRSSDRLTIRGTETYYRKSDSLPFAQVMQEEVVKSLGLPDRGALRHPESIIVLYRTDMPAVLVEVAYISNPQDEALLKEDEFRQRAAEGIVNGVKRYVSESDLFTTLLRRQEANAPTLTPPPTEENTTQENK